MGLVLIGIIAVAFTAAIGFPSLDTAREEVAIATALDVARSGIPADQVSNCFQGFCFEDDSSFAEKWWDFSTTYLILVWPGILLAVVVGGLTDGFLFPSGQGPAFGSWRTASTTSRARLRGSTPLAIGTADPSLAALSVGALNAPAIAMTVVLFSPTVWLTRVGVAALIVVPVVALATRRSVVADEVVVDRQGVGHESFIAGRTSVVAAWRFALRLVPLFVVAAALGGLGTRYFTEAGVTSVLGPNPVGILVAVLGGLALDLPLTFGIPLGALGLIIGADPMVVGVFLVTATLAGPRSLTVLARSERGVVATVAVVVLSVVGSFAGLGAARIAIAATSGPTITWDGEQCTYSGPARFEPRVYDFTIRNEVEDLGDGKTMAIIVGRLPANVSVEHLSATVAADLTAPLPEWFTVAGTQEFIFPETEHVAQITFHDAGTYAAVCLYGGGFQPMGWFDEFRLSFNGYVADTTFQVSG
jgi:hypothetical protein